MIIHIGAIFFNLICKRKRLRYGRPRA